MASEWVAGVFGALGAALGAGAALASSWIGTRAQRDLAIANRKGQVAEVRRAAYGEYLTTVYSFMDRSRELVGRIENDAATRECDASHRAYLEDWERLQPTYAPVVIAGPNEIEESAEALRFRLGVLADECDRWYAAHKNGTKFGRTGKVFDAQLAAKEARSAFASAARKHAYG